MMIGSTNNTQTENNQKTINDLCGAEHSKEYNFIIPAYQRGYRWTPDQVNDLLNDIDDNPKGRRYCLQPLVVKLKEKNEQKNSVTYELIDGQQRLTTFYLILCALSYPETDKLFSLSTERSIKYKSLETENKDFNLLQNGLNDSTIFFDALKEFVDCKNYRKNGISQLSYNSFFKDLLEQEEYKNIDRFYLLQAMKIILTHYYDEEGYFKIAGITADTLINRIKEDFYFLWYETGTANDNKDNDSAEAAFSRLNSGKIALNNADLIKALLLRRENLMIDDIKNADSKWLNGWLDTQRSEIISQWDNMEQILRSDDDRFWNFIVAPEKLNSSSNSYFSRLEIIFDLQMGTDKQKNDDINQQYRIYRFFENKVKDTKCSDKNQSISSVIWTETIKIFNIMREWYEDHELYHYIGYLSCVPVSYIAGNPKTDNGIEITEKNDLNWIDVLIILVEYAKTHSKDKFRSEIKKLVSWTVLKNIRSYDTKDLDDLLAKLTYDKKKDDEASQEQNDKNLIENKDLIKCLLLLGNVQELITSKNMREADHKFPFKMLKTDVDTKLKLTLEHILPQNPEFTASNNQDKSIEDLKKIYQEFHSQLTKYGIEHEYQEKDDSDDPEFYKDRINDLWDKANPPAQKVNAQRFYNLALLPHGTNAELSNHIFPEKRNKLLEATEKQYIPLSTQNVFLKRYSGRNKSSGQAKQEQQQEKKQESPLFWLESDAVAYRDAMAVLLSEFNLDKKEDEKGC